MEEKEKEVTLMVDIVFIEITAGLSCDTWLGERYVNNYFIRYN